MDFNAATLAAAKAWNELPQEEKDAYTVKAQAEKLVYKEQYKEYCQKRQEYERMTFSPAVPLAGPPVLPAAAPPVPYRTTPLPLPIPASLTIGFAPPPATSAPGLAGLLGSLLTRNTADPRRPSSGPPLPTSTAAALTARRASDPAGGAAAVPAPAPSGGIEGPAGPQAVPTTGGAVPLGTAPPQAVPAAQPETSRLADKPEFQAFLASVAARAPPGVRVWDWLSQMGGKMLEGTGPLQTPAVTSPRGGNGTAGAALSGTAEASDPEPAASLAPASSTGPTPTTNPTLLMGLSGNLPDKPVGAIPLTGLLPSSLSRPPVQPTSGLAWPVLPSGHAASRDPSGPQLGQVVSSGAVPLGSPAVPQPPAAIGAPDAVALSTGMNANQSKFAGVTQSAVPPTDNEHRPLNPGIVRPAGPAMQSLAAPTALPSVAVPLNPVRLSTISLSL
jgi:hypothetical protein